MDTWDRVVALRIGFAAQAKKLSPAEWDAPTLCEDWRVRDVVAHPPIRHPSPVGATGPPTSERPRGPDDPSSGHQKAPGAALVVRHGLLGTVAGAIYPDKGARGAKARSRTVPARHRHQMGTGRRRPGQRSIGGTDPRHDGASGDSPGSSRDRDGSARGAHRRAQSRPGTGALDEGRSLTWRQRTPDEAAFTAGARPSATHRSSPATCTPASSGT